MILEAQGYFCNLHDVECNQKYAKSLPYSFHLNQVAQVALLFEKLIPNKDEKLYPLNQFSPYTVRQGVIAACYGHDSIEDARISYNDINSKFGPTVAEIIYLCTEDKGRNRAERKSDVWYNHLKTNDLAVFVKLCDIIANSSFSLISSQSMFKKYKSEYTQKVKPHLYCEQYKPMFDLLDSIYNLPI